MAESHVIAQQELPTQLFIMAVYCHVFLGASVYYYLRVNYRIQLSFTRAKATIL